MKLNTGMIENILMVVIVIIIVFTVLADTGETIGDASYNLTQENGSGAQTYPLLSFFKAKGILLLAFMAGIVILLIKAFMGKLGGK